MNVTLLRKCYKSAQLIVLFSSMAIFASCSKKVVNQISWQHIKVLADGEASEWKYPKQYDSKTELAYCVSNDDQNLYLLISTGQQTNQMKAMRAGISLEFNTTGKKNYTASLMYPLKSNERMDREEMQKQVSGQAPEDSKEMTAIIRQKFLMEQTVMRTYGLHNVPEGPLKLKNDQGVRVAIDWDAEETMIYEAVVPLASLLQENGLVNQDTATILGLKITLHGIERPQHTADGPAGGGGFSGGGQGGPPGGSGFPTRVGGAGGFPGGESRPGGMPLGNRNMSEMMQIFEPSIVQLKFRLAGQTLSTHN